MGQAVRLKNGWIGIVNRGQADIMSKVHLNSPCLLSAMCMQWTSSKPYAMVDSFECLVLGVSVACMVQVPMEEARKKELDFFKGSRHYSDLKNVGTGFLSSKLSTHLITAIRKQLPIIQHSINDGIINLERELEALGGPAVTTRGAMVHLILQVTTLRLAQSYCLSEPVKGICLGVHVVSAVCICLIHIGAGAAVREQQEEHFEKKCTGTLHFTCVLIMGLLGSSCAANSRRPLQSRWMVGRAAGSRSCWCLRSG